MSDIQPTIEQQQVDVIRKLAIARATEMQTNVDVTDVDKLCAWYDYYARSAELEHIAVSGPDQSFDSERILNALTRVLRGDRARRGTDSNAALHLVLHKRDAEPWEVLPCPTREDAITLYDHLSVNWTETYLVLVERGPREIIERRPW